MLDGADLPTLRIGGLTSAEAAVLLSGLAPGAITRLYGATAGNPLALLELAPDAQDLVLAPEGAPVLVSATISGAFLRRVGTLDEAARRALLLAASSESGDLPMLERAAAQLRIDLSALAAAENAGLVTLGRGHGRIPPSAGPVGDLRRRPGRGPPRRAPGARRRPARPGRRPPRVAPGRRGGRRGRVSVGRARAGRDPGPRAQCLRDRGRRVRAGWPSHRRQRAAGPPAARGGRGGLARRTGRSRRHAARRGPRGHRRPSASWSRSTSWPGTSRSAGAR